MALMITTRVQKCMFWVCPRLTTIVLTILANLRSPQDVFTLLKGDRVGGRRAVGDVSRVARRHHHGVVRRGVIVIVHRRRRVVRRRQTCAADEIHERSQSVSLAL